jgi:predicted nuclease with TOPRIM domain
MLALKNLLENMVDDEGNPREPTEEELQTMQKWFEDSLSDFEKKFDNYCKFIKNLKMEAAIAEEERKTYKAELDRLSKRSKAFENKAKSVNNLLWWSMQRLNMKNYKTALFSAKEQNTQITINPLAGSSLKEVPEEFLKPRELNVTAIKEAIKDGTLKQGNGTPLGETKLYFVSTGEELKDVRWTQGTALIIR